MTDDHYIQRSVVKMIAIQSVKIVTLFFMLDRMVEPEIGCFVSEFVMSSVISITHHIIKRKQLLHNG